MRFLIVLALVVLIAGAFMMEDKKKPIKKYFKKKWCKCIKEAKGICKKLKCCEIYLHVPYKVLIKYCKYGKCVFVKKHKKHEKKHKKHEKHAGVSK